MLYKIVGINISYLKVNFLEVCNILYTYRVIFKINDVKNNQNSILKKYLKILKINNHNNRYRKAKLDLKGLRYMNIQ